jgi:membrane protease YdiL (CAAX protease family)
MATLTAFLRRRPVLVYYVLVFVISWGGILSVVGLSGLPATPAQVEQQMPLVLVALLAGPSVAGLVMTGLVYGRPGYRALLARLLKWRVGARWYAVALLTAPLAVLAVLLPLSLVSPVFLPAILTTDAKAPLLLMGISVGLVGGLCEELGWTGFAIPTLRRRYAVLATGLITGVLWGAWHFLVNFWLSGDTAGALSLAILLPSIVAEYGELPAFRVLMVWVYDRTESLLVAILMHASLIFSTLFVLNAATTGSPAVLWHLGLAAVLWLVVAAVTMANHGQLSRPGQPLAGIGSPQLTPR